MKIKLVVEARVDGRNPKRCSLKCPWIEDANGGWFNPYCAFQPKCTNLLRDTDGKCIRTRACLRAEKREG